MRLRSTVVIGAAGVATMLSGVAGAGAVSAERPERAPVTVTIRSEGTDIFGTVASTRPRRCAADRTVELYKLVDGDPHLWTSDTTQLIDGRYRWSAGNTGTTGRFFARVRRTAECQGDVSPTIRVRRTS